MYMIQDVKITEKEINNLHAKGASLDPHSFDLDKLSHSGSHVGEVADQSGSEEYDLSKISSSGIHVAEVTED